MGAIDLTSPNERQTWSFSGKFDTIDAKVCASYEETIPIDELNKMLHSRLNFGVSDLASRRIECVWFSYRDFVLSCSIRISTFQPQCAILVTPLFSTCFVWITNYCAWHFCNQLNRDSCHGTLFFAPWRGYLWWWFFSLRFMTVWESSRNWLIIGRLGRRHFLTNVNKPSDSDANSKERD